MKIPITIKAIQMLTKEEMKLFQLFLASPFHNKNALLNRMLDWLKPYVDPKSATTFSKKALFEFLYPQQGYNEARIRNLMSELLHQVQAFLVQIHLKSQSILAEKSLLNELMQREGFTLVSKSLEKLEGALQQKNWPDESYFYDVYQLSHFEDLNLLNQEKRGHSKHLQAKSEALDHYFLLEKLRVACEMQSRNVVVQSNYICHFMDELLLFFEHLPKASKHQRALEMYVTAYKMLKDDPNQAHFYHLKNLLQNLSTSIPITVLKDLYTYMLNIGVREVNTGNTKFYAEVLNLYKILLEKGILLSGGNLTQWAFTNIVMAGIRLKDYDWTETFILSYAAYLPSEVRDNAVAFNRANLAFEKKEYHQAQKQLLTVEFHDAYYQLAAKVLLLKIYFLNRESEPLCSLVETSKRLIERNRQLSDYQKKSNHNFFRFALRLYTRLTAVNRSPSKIVMLKAQIEQCDLLANKQWLLEQMPK
jgi:hypothetical protein